MKPLQFCLLLVFTLLAAATAKAQNEFFAMCYHDITSETIQEVHHDSGVVSLEHLIQHFEWIKDNGYTVVSLEQIIAAKEGNTPLPKKAIYLTFDDGYRSFYTHVYPLLKLYNYPATFALVTSWIESDEPVQYGNKLKSTNQFLNWEQVREMQASGLVEIASHTHDLHRGIIGNPQGNEQPAAITRLYDGANYETEEDYHSRIALDLKTSFEQITHHTGVEPRAIVWPYGSFSDQAWTIAQSVGFTQSLILEDGNNTLSPASKSEYSPILSRNEHIKRYLVSDNPTDGDISIAIEPYAYQQPHRAIHVDLDYVYDPNPEQQHRNLSLLLDRVRALKVSHVYLQAFADQDGDGNASALYFPNRVLPMKADLFNRVAWQLRTRAEVKVFAWMPVSAFDLGDEFYQQYGVKEWREGKVQPAINNYRRLSIFSEPAKEAIRTIYEDLGRYSSVAGILFHDDAFLSDYEDVGPDALDYYRKQGLQFSSIDALRSDALIDQWTSVKTQALIDFTHELSAILERYNGPMVTARNIYAQPVINTESRRWFAQDLTKFIEHYDYTAIMAMPFMEQSENPQQWLKQLIATLPQKNRIVLELQSIDWRTQTKISSQLLLQQMEFLMQHGFIHFAYYPDDFINNHPNLDVIKAGISLNTIPEQEKGDE